MRQRERKEKKPGTQRNTVETGTREKTDRVTDRKTKYRKEGERARRERWQNSTPTSREGITESNTAT